ncbi:MAG: PspA/IM30 family protein [Chloroflexota bacterium]
MSILDRVGLLLRSNINDLLDRAEDPEKTINQLIIDMNNQLADVRKQVAGAIADENQLHDKFEDNQAKANDWEEKARLAVSKNEDELAKEALTRRNNFQQTADGFRAQWQEQSTQVAELKGALESLTAKVQEAETKRDLLIARSRRAKAESSIRETLQGIDKTSAVSDFERMDDRVSRQEAEAKALRQLETDDVEERFKKLESDSDVDAQLADLKSKMGRS